MAIRQKAVTILHQAIDIVSSGEEIHEHCYTGSNSMTQQDECERLQWITNWKSEKFSDSVVQSFIPGRNALSARHAFSCVTFFP